MSSNIRHLDGLHIDASQKDFDESIAFWSNASVDQLRQLILPAAGKSYWLRCAMMFQTLPVDRLALLSEDLFEWLKDMNWPGANTIKISLLKCKNDFTEKSLSNSLVRADGDGDYEWLDNLNSFKTDYYIK